jgi:hypothetical protein
MATTDYDFSATRDQIIRQALIMVGAVARTDYIPAEQYNEAVFVLNLLIKAWQSEGIYLWTPTVMTQELAAQTASYTLSSDPPVVGLQNAYLIRDTSTASTTTTTTTTTTGAPVPRQSEWWNIIAEFMGYENTYLAALPQTITVSIASPAVVSLTSHGFSGGHMVSFSTTGALPTGITAGTIYTVMTAGLGTDTFQISATGAGGPAVDTTGTQSGVHTLYPVDKGILGTYYDGILCNYRLYNKFLSATYNTYATEAAAWYQDRYVNSLATPGQVAGYYNYMEGLVERYVRTISAATLTAINNLLTSALYLNANPGDDIYGDHTFSREVAYALHAFVHAGRILTLTPTQTTRRSELLEAALNHIDLWAVSQTASYFRPFMGGLTARSLIDYYERVDEDSRIPTALTNLANYMIDSCYVEGPVARLEDGVMASYSFNYTDRNIGSTDPYDLSPQPDLSLIVCPLFGWLYKYSGLPKWREYGDKIFQGAIPIYDAYGTYESGAYLGTRNATNPLGKHIDQQLMWGPKYIEWAESVSTGETQIESPPSTSETKQPIRIISYKEYLEIQDRGEAGEPDTISFFFSRSPLVYVYPVPDDDTYSLELVAIAKLKDWDAHDSHGDFPVKYEKAILYQLAVDLCDSYGVSTEMRNRFQSTATYLLGKARNSDRAGGLDIFVKGAF